jgi:hypothetical protein
VLEPARAGRAAAPRFASRASRRRRTVSRRRLHDGLPRRPALNSLRPPRCGTRRCVSHRPDQGFRKRASGRSAGGAGPRGRGSNRWAPCRRPPGRGRHQRGAIATVAGGASSGDPMRGHMCCFKEPAPSYDPPDLTHGQPGVHRTLSRVTASRRTSAGQGRGLDWTERSACSESKPRRAPIRM